MSKLLVDYYLGAYGKTIYIKSVREEGILFLKDLFHRLSTKHIMKYAFRDDPGIQITGIHDLILRNSDQEIRIERGKERRPSSGIKIQMTGTTVKD